jgi:hypothetical protein
MRSLPTPARIAIATLIIRYRAARRDHARLAETLGDRSPATNAADARCVEVWNSLHSLRRNLFDEQMGERVSVGDAHAFMRYVAQGAAVRRRVALRRVA